MPTTPAITQARERLGRNLFPEPFEQTCGPGSLGTSRQLPEFYPGTVRGVAAPVRLLAIDGFEVEVPDTEANAAEFRYAGSGPTGRRPLPEGAGGGVGLLAGLGRRRAPPTGSYGCVQLLSLGS